MANYKKISTVTTTGRTVYAMVSRDADGYFLATDKASFASGAGYPALSEHATMKGLFILNTNDAAWDDGTYSIVAYSQAGASPAPASDTVLSYGTMRIVDDLEVISQPIALDLVEGTLSIQDVLRVLLAEAVGITTGSRTTTICFRNQANTKNRITGTMDSTGNRSAVTLDVT